MGIFVYSSTATGKSYVSKKYKNVIDMESTIYKYVGLSNENEQIKSTNRKINKEWPENYFKALDVVKDKYDYILIADEVCDNYFNINNYKYWRVYPDIKLKNEYINRCIKRGNNDEFIYWYSKVWDEWYYLCKNDNKTDKHIVLKHNEYLEDVLPGLIPNK